MTYPELLEAVDAIIAAHDAPLRPTTLAAAGQTFDRHGIGQCTKHGLVYGHCASCVVEREQDFDSRSADHVRDVFAAINAARSAIASGGDR